MDKNVEGDRPHWYSGEYTADRVRDRPVRALFEAIVYVGDQLKLLRQDLSYRAYGKTSK